MTGKTKTQSDKDRTDAKLDEALAETFPASDPPAMRLAEHSMNG